MMKTCQSRADVQGSKGYQTAHLVRRTDTFYPNLWVNASSNTGGLWLPTFWARSRFVMLDSAARSLRSAIKVPLTESCADA